jgi:hypothetical protein
MKWGRHHFILSAGHVFERAAPKDLRVLTFEELPRDYIAPRTISHQDVADPCPLTEDSVIHRCEWEDLAIVTVDHDRFPRVDFTDLADSWIDPTAGQDVDGCGFPTDHNVAVEKRILSDGREQVDLGLYPTLFGGRVSPFPSPDEVKFYYGGDLDPQKHYLIPYQSGGVSDEPAGISGSAVWWWNNERQVIWRPNFIFAGTVTHYHRKKMRIRVVKASVVRRFVTELFGNP